MSEKKRLTAWGHLQPYDKEIPIGSYSKDKTISEGPYKIVYEKGPIHWSLKGLIIFIIPIPIWIPERLERVVIYENNIPFEENRTEIDNNFIGLVCNFIFPLAGKGCNFRKDRPLFDADPLFELKSRLDRTCSPEANKNLNFIMQKNSLTLNLKPLTRFYAKQIFEISKIPYTIINSKYKDRIIVKYIDNNGLIVINESIIFEYQEGLNREFKSCSFNGKLNLFGLEIHDHLPAETIKQRLNKFAKPYTQAYIVPNYLYFETDLYRINVNVSHFGYVKSIYIELKNNSNI